jgi:hypothetical protein
MINLIIIINFNPAECSSKEWNVGILQFFAVCVKDSVKKRVIRLEKVMTSRLTRRII